MQTRAHTRPTAEIPRVDFHADAPNRPADIFRHFFPDLSSPLHPRLIHNWTTPVSGTTYLVSKVRNGLGDTLRTGVSTTYLRQRSGGGDSREGHN